MTVALAQEDTAEAIALSGFPESASSGLIRSAQERWASLPIKDRLAVLRGARHELARRTPELAAAISSNLARTPADTRVAEILPLLAACKFLEQNAAALLAPRKLGRRGLPFWLAGVDSEIHHVALGRVLVIGPANYPLFLPGVQALQALAAGNAVTWKPGDGGYEVAMLFAEALRAAGLPGHLLRVTGEGIAATQASLEENPDKVFFTGSAETGRILMRRLAETLTPCVTELSGCDAAIVLPSADLKQVVQALAFGMRFNGSATCMAPRRVLLVDATTDLRESFLAELRGALADVPPVALSSKVTERLSALLDDAARQGARVDGNCASPTVKPILVTHAHSAMRLVRADVFAPMLSVLEVSGEDGVVAAQNACPFALTASIFGDEAAARQLARRITAGTITINGLIVPTADPRLPFGGRKQSGFGVTRGAGGLLEMTAVKTIVVQRGKSSRPYEPTTTAHEPLFDGVIQASHARTWRDRLQGLKRLATAGKDLGKHPQ